ncbi:hypothetical protein [Streptomyces fulvoviolaceus]|uniref:hypothetical protein n=1 Tax=Streptomyces fulvoviolaceus TaxID=285535 RepID=UPI0004C97817|nr:hypothetical protein [Streptomyces fulvoviolaceus]MCT9076515.1 hypothetical protein [Streptomyces fulvoviolaceus]
MNSGAIRRRLAVGLALLTASGLLAVAAPAEAQAASSCAGRKVRSYPFRTGILDVYKRRGYVCAITTSKQPGVKRTMSVSVRVYGLQPVVDKGRYRYRAGPVTVHAGHQCVWVKGSVGRGSYDTEGWILC